MHQTRNEVKTVAALANVTLAHAAIIKAMEASRHLPRMLCFYGRAGFGKTSAASYLRAKHRAYYVECKSTWTRKKLLEDILKDMGIEPEKTIYDMCDQVCKQLATSGRPLIIDQVDFLVEKKAIEIVRDIYDGSKGVVMIIGEEFLPGKLKRWECFHSRILEWTRAKPADMDDAMTLAEFYCRKLPADVEAVEYIHSRAGGSLRRICVNLENSQDKALSLGLDRITLDVVQSIDFYTGSAPVGGE